MADGQTAQRASVTDDNDHFTQVSRAKSKPDRSSGRRGRLRPGKGKGNGKGRAGDERSLSALLADKQEMLKRRGYVQRCIDALGGTSSKNDRADPPLPDSVIKRFSACRKCVCLGLGSLRDSPKSLVQLAFLLGLFDVLEMQTTVIFTDPAFADEDLAYLESLGHAAQRQNHSLAFDEPTFLYLPHCPRSLYEAILGVNTERLDRLLLLSNQLSLYAEREMRAEELQRIPNLQRLGETFECVPLPECEDRPDAFNDMAWQWHEGKDEDEGDKIPDTLNVDRVS